MACELPLHLAAGSNRWLFSVPWLKVTLEASRHHTPFDELLLTLYTPWGLYVCNHDLVFGELSGAGSSRLILAAEKHAVSWHEALHRDILPRLEEQNSHGRPRCPRIASVSWATLTRWPQAQQLEAGSRRLMQQAQKRELADECGDNEHPDETTSTERDFATEQCRAWGSAAARPDSADAEAVAAKASAPREMQLRSQHLNGLQKLGNGRNARWRIGHFRKGDATRESGAFPWPSGGELGTLTYDIEVSLQPDKNPSYDCIKLVLSSDEQESSSSGEHRLVKMGYMLLEQRPATASDLVMGNGHLYGPSLSLRGMAVSERLRGQGLGTIFFAVWLRVCLETGIVPRANRINKPLLSLLLKRFGFEPHEGGVEVELSPAEEGGGAMVLYSSKGASKLKGWFNPVDLKMQNIRIASTRPAGPSTVVSVQTSFNPPPDKVALDDAVSAAMASHVLQFEVSPDVLRRALTASNKRIARVIGSNSSRP